MSQASCSLEGDSRSGRACEHRERASGRVRLARWAQRGAVALLIAAVPVACVNAPPSTESADASCRRVIHADVVAIEQAYVLNRHAAFVPAGMLYALRHDVVPLDAARPLGPGNAMLRPDKRPRPLVLRVNEGDCLQVAFENLLDPQWEEEGGLPPDMGGRLPAHIEASAGEPLRYIALLAHSRFHRVIVQAQHAGALRCHVEHRWFTGERFRPQRHLERATGGIEIVSHLSRRSHR